MEIPDPVVNIDETEEDSGDSASCPAFVDGENLEEIDDACVATFDDEGELEPSESEDTLPGISIVSTLGLITLIAFLRRKSYV